MRYLLAILLPWLSLILQGKLLQGLLCLFLQITILGWFPAALWAILSVNKMYADRRNKKIIQAMNQNQTIVIEP